jgi:glycosyltransferase involved in cell wall biosynthesis
MKIIDLTDSYIKNILEENVSIRRFNNILDAYAQADVVISPERFCSYGLAVSESLSLGIPTFMAPIPTYLEIGFGYKHAIFPDKNEPEYFAQKIIEFLSEKRNFNSDTKKFRDQNSFEKCSG